MSAPVAYDRKNENAFRQYAEAEFALAYRKDGDIILPFGFALGFTGANGEEVRFVLNSLGAFTLTVDGVEILNLTSTSATFALNTDGRVTGIRLSNGTTGTIDMLADVFNFYDGVTDRPLLSAGGGLLTINGDLEVTGSIFIGSVRWPISMQPATFQKADGDAILWAGGSALNTIPDVAITIPSGVALAAGEAWETPTITGATTVGGTLRLKISTPAGTTTLTDTTDAAGGGGDPDRVMAKANPLDAYNGIYNFRVQGHIRIRSIYSAEDGGYVNTGETYFSTWFDDGGGWDEGALQVVSVWDVGISAVTGGSSAGLYAFDVTVPISWGNPIGAGGTYAYGVSFDSGGSGADITDFVSVSYLEQTTSGTRTGSPSGETATIIVTPKNL